MNRIKLAAAGAVIAGSSLVGGLVAGIFNTNAIGVNAANGTLAAATGETGATGQTGGSGAFKSNEDPAHESSESATRESDENSGKARRHGARHGMHKPNETAGHESSESAEREAQENAATTAAPGQ
jgi:hypothetical protein